MGGDGDSRPTWPTQRLTAGFDSTCFEAKKDGAQGAIELNGKRFRRKFGTTSGELNEREVAGMMTREIRLELKQGPYSRITGFSGPIPYPKGF